MGHRHACALVLAILATGCVVDDEGATSEEAEPSVGPGAEVHLPGAPRERRAIEIHGAKVSYDVVEGEVVMGGDMLYGPVAEFEAELRRLGGVARDDARWKMPIRYSFADNVGAGTRYAIELAMAELRTESSATISFQRCTGLCLAPRIRFDNDGSGCSSDVGRQLLGNRIHLTDFCDGVDGDVATLRRERGSIKHELMHALGMQHEQTRCDRDAFVRINAANIDPAKCDAFNLTDRYCGGHDDLGAYDFASVMHYGGRACAYDGGGRTIETLDPAMQGLLGSRDALSQGDAASLRAMYGFTAPPSGPIPWCGDGVCGGGESASSCVADCGGCPYGSRLPGGQCPEP
jgi:hypothetical protein